MANTCKYYKQQRQVSMNSGQTWSNVVPAEYRRGSLIETESEDCRDEILITRWIDVPDAYICDGKDKYQKQVGQYSLDNGSTWQYYYPSVYQMGSFISANADECNNRWEGYYFLGENQGDCPSGYVYIEGYGCYYPQSPQPQHHNGRPIDPIKYVRCSSSSSTTLTNLDVAYSHYTLYEGIVGDCISEIGEYAFNGCTSLSSITIPDSVTIIGRYAFLDCTSLSSITIPNSVITIGDYAFNRCTSLSSITIPDSVTSIGFQAFMNCTNLKSVIIEESIAEINTYAFSGCTSLTSVTINDTTPPSLGYYVFDNTNDCPIYVPCESVSAYKRATNWNTYASRIQAIPDSCPTYKLTAAYNDSTTYQVECNSSSALRTGDTRAHTTPYSAMTSAVIGDCVTTIGDEAFKGCTSLSSITIPNSVTSIGSDAFKGCSALTNVTIPSGITSIEGGAFAGCSSLSSITIPNSVTSIGYDAFSGCTSLSSITIPNSVTSIGSDAFKGCTSLSSIAIPNSVTGIDFETFAGCTSLSSITMNNVTWIDDVAFAGCTSLSSITIPSMVTHIGYGAFGGCSHLEEVLIQYRVTEIGHQAFSQSGLRFLGIKAPIPPALGVDVFRYSNLSLILVPTESVDAYKSASGWSDYAGSIYGHDWD